MSARRPTVGALHDRLAATRVLGLPVELFGALLVGVTLRLYGLGDESLWMDEVFTLTVATESTLEYLLFGLPAVEPHPPLHTVIMWGWVRFMGVSEVALRLPSVAFGVATIPVLYSVGRTLYGRAAAGIAVAFFAVAPFQIWYAQEARMYTLYVFLTVLSIWCLLRLLDDFTRRRAAAYVGVAALLAYTHVFALFVLLSQAVFLAWLSVRREGHVVTLRRFVGVYAAVGAAIAPWLVLLVRRFVVSDPDAAGKVAWLPETEPVMLWQTFTLFAFGYARGWVPYWSLARPPTVALFVVAGVLLLVAYGWWDEQLRLDLDGRGHDETPQDLLVGCWLLIPVFVPYVVSVLVTPVFVHRYVIAAAPAFLLLLARGVTTLRTRHLRYAIAALLLAGMFVPLPGYYAADQKDQWREAAEFVATDAQDGDVVIVAPPWVADAFDYYFDRPRVDRVVLDQDPDPDALATAIEGDGDVYLVMAYVAHWEEETIREGLAAETGTDPERHDTLYVEVYVYRR